MGSMTRVVRELEASEKENRRLREQIREMTEFLEDYGLSWVGTGGGAASASASASASGGVAGDVDVAGPFVSGGGGVASGGGYGVSDSGRSGVMASGMPSGTGRVWGNRDDKKSDAKEKEDKEEREKEEEEDELEGELVMARGRDGKSSKEGGEGEGREGGRRDDGFPLASSPIVTSGFTEAMLPTRDFASPSSRPTSSFPISFPTSVPTSVPPSLPPTISYPVLYKHIEALNRLINEDPARIVVQNKRGRIVQAAEAVEKVRIRLYKNGLLVKRGPFRYTNTSTYASFIAGTLF